MFMLEPWYNYLWTKMSVVGKKCIDILSKSVSYVKKSSVRTLTVSGTSVFSGKSPEPGGVKRKRRVLSAIQPTGSLHLGNYLGAVKNWVDLQNAGEETFYAVADLHAITVPQDPKTLRENILGMTASLLACGIDPEKSILFQQSKVKQHTQLCWVLGSITSMAKLGQQTQLKEKKEIMLELSSSLYLYPVLQAADILLYRATHVPVGEDQVSHLQLAVHLAKMFNKRFGKSLVVPTAMINEDASCRLKSLRNPAKKMSKSDLEYKGRINLTDTPEEILLKCKKAVTDFTSAVTYDPVNRPGVSNLLLIHSLLTGKSIDHICKEVSNLESAQYKLVMAEEIIEALRPIREKLNQLSKEPAYLQAVLDAGSIKAEECAEETWQQVHTQLGFGDSSKKADRKAVAC